jgi:hypothetical protein
MNATERSKRNEQILQMFVAGVTYQQIAKAVGLRSPSTVHEIIHKEMAGAAQRREMLVDEAFAVFQERSERLFRAHWGKALDVDSPNSHKSAEVCRKILAQQARMYGIDEPVGGLANNMGVVDTDEETNPLNEQEPQDELARLRAIRAGA